MVGVVIVRIAAAAFLVGSRTGGSSDMPITSRSFVSARAPLEDEVAMATAPAAPTNVRRDKRFTSDSLR